MKTTTATLHNDITAATGCEYSIDLSERAYGGELTIGSERWNYLVGEIAKLHNEDPSEFAKLSLSDEDRAKAKDFMTMANLANDARPIRPVQPEPYIHAVPPMGGRKKVRRHDGLGILLGVMLSLAVLCIFVMAIV